MPQNMPPSPLELVKTDENRTLFIFHSGFVAKDEAESPENRKINVKVAEQARALAYVATTVSVEFGIAQRTREISDDLPGFIKTLGRGALNNKLIIEFYPDENRTRSFPSPLVLGAAIAKEIGEVDELRDIIDEEAPFWVTDIRGDSSHRTRISYK